MLAALYILGLLAAAWVSGLALVSTGAMALPAAWLPAGVLLGAGVATSAARLPLWGALGFVALTGAFAGRGAPLLAAVALAAIATACAMVAAYVVHRRVRGRVHLGHFNDALTLVLAAVAAAFVTGLLAVPVVGVGGFRSVLLAAAVGLLVGAPLVAGLITERRWWREVLGSWRLLEVVIVVAGAAAVTEAVFGERVEPFLRVPAFVLPFMLWPAFRFGPSGSALVIAIICTDAFHNLARLRGPYLTDQTTIDEALLRGQGSIVMLTISFAVLASIVAERREALEEIKTLRGLIPICAWCHKVRDEAEVWQRLETYLDANTDATFSHSICPSCAAAQHVAAEQPGSPHPWKI